jgi:hypothetical protein
MRDSNRLRSPAMRFATWAPPTANSSRSSRQVLPKLVTRNLKQDITCVPYQQSGGRFLVRGEILRSLPSS